MDIYYTFFSKKRNTDSQITILHIFDIPTIVQRMIREILLLGNPALYQRSMQVTQADRPQLSQIEQDLHDTLMEYRRVHKAGRAISAPQIGIRKRIIYLHIDKPILIINPSLLFHSPAQIEIMDDCMSFPNLLVRVLRYKCCRLNYTDRNWKDAYIDAEDDLAELLQHEYDHLDGILATMRAKDLQSFFIKPEAK